VDYYLIDLETTSLNTAYCRILSGTAVSLNNPSELFNERSNVPVNKDHIAYRHLATPGKMSDLDLVKELSHFLASDIKKPVVGWNILKFDAPILRRYGLDLSKRVVIDLMVTFKESLGLHRYPSLVSVCERFNITDTEAVHTSLGDVNRMVKLLQLMKGNAVDNKILHRA